MERIRTVIVDDEELARLRIHRLLEKEPDIEILGECADGVEAIPFIEAYRPDLVFLDIEMMAMDGFTTIEQLRMVPLPIVVFITAYDQYAIRAFEANALDYLLKPFTEERFSQALERCRERIRARQIEAYSGRLLSLLKDIREDQPVPAEHPEPAPEPGTILRRLVLKSGGRLIFVDAEQVDWFEAEGVYVRVHVGAKSHLLRESLSNVEARVDPSLFVRIHRSTLVNVQRIKEIVPHLNGGSIVILNDGRRLKMSRSYKDRVSNVLG